MPVEIFPLFGDSWSLFDHEPSMNASESTYIKGRLGELPSGLEAPLTYQLLKGYLVEKYAFAEASQSAQIFERFLIWCFFIKKKSALLVSADDLLDYLRFNSNPPSELVRDRMRSKRFLFEDECCVTNPAWRPFPLSKYAGLECTRSRLNTFYRYLTPHIGRSVNLPRGAIAGILPPKSTYGELEAMANEYFARFLEVGSTQDSRTYKRRASDENKLFILATCHILRIPFADLLKVADYFSMSHFVLSPGGWILNIPAAQGDLFRNIPAEYLAYLTRYRELIGLDNFPSISETNPIFRSRAHVKMLMDSLPTYNGLESPGKLLKRLSCYWRRELAPSVTGNTETLETPSFRPVLDRLQHFSRSMLAESLPLPNISEPPPPLCYFLNKVDPETFPSDYRDLRFRLIKKIGDSDLEFEPLRLFASYANSCVGQRSRLKVRALEKLALWSCIVNRKSIVEMIADDVDAFYRFCACPPLSWCVDKKNPKRHIVNVENMEFVANPAWRPFKVGFESEVQSSRRAGRVIIWCDAVMQDLIAEGLIGHNAFTMLSKNLVYI